MLCVIESKQHNPVFKIERQQQQNKDVFCQHFVIKTNFSITWRQTHKASVTRAILTPNIMKKIYYNKKTFNNTILFVKILVLHFKIGSNNHESRFSLQMAIKNICM
jgi:hypothetical protein